MEINEFALDKSEKIIYGLRELYLSKGFSRYKMNKFEEYDLYAENKDFLVSDNVITFTDTDGKLLALKPDVTLSIIKNSKDLPDITQKICYNENVYRSTLGGSFKEIMQVGVECFGKVSADDVWEILTLAADSLKLISDSYVLTLSDLDIIEALVANVTEKKHIVNQIYEALSDKNTTQIIRLLGEERSRLLVELSEINGAPSSVLPVLKKIIERAELNAVAEPFVKILQKAINSQFADVIKVDFSVIGDFNYYNGLVFKGYVKDIPVEVLSGGQYDNLLKKMSRSSKAVGFAVYTDRSELADDNKFSSDDYINVALPKGRLGEKAYEALAQAGYPCPSILEPNRKLIFENDQVKVRYFWVKPSDIAIYVERGAADIGIAGKDIIDEYKPDVYELTDLGLGKCKMAVAAPVGYEDDHNKTLIVATKFSRIARNYYQSKGRSIDIIHLNGSIEIAPILGLSDVIVDIVETGRTLKENNLEVIEEIQPISARLIANKASYKFKGEAIDALKKRLSVKE